MAPPETSDPLVLKLCLNSDAHGLSEATHPEALHQSCTVSLDSARAQSEFTRDLFVWFPDG